MALNEIKMSMSLVTAGVTTALGKMKTGISDFANSANEKLGSVAKMATGALAAAFTVAAKGALEYGKEIKNLAAISDAGVEEFQKIAIAAKTVGIEQDKLADQFKDFGERVGQMVRLEGGELEPFFEGIGKEAGVTAEAMDRLSGPEAFGLFYRTLEQAGVKGAALSSYLEDVGSDMTGLIPIYKDNAKVLNELGDAAEKNGLIMSEATADALAKSQLAIDNFKQKAVIYVGEIISGKADNAALKALGARFGAMMAQVGEWMTNAFLGALKHLTAGLAASVEVVKDYLTKAFQVAGLTLQKLVAEAFNSISDGLSKIGIDLAKVDTAAIQKQIDTISFDEPGTSWNKFNDKYLDSMGEWKVSTKGAQDAWNGLADTYDSMSKTSGVVAIEQAKFTEAARQAAVSAAAAANAQKNISEEVRLQAELKEAIASGDIEAVKVIEDALKIEKEIQKVMKESGVTRDQATKHVMALRGEEQKLANEKNAQTEKEKAAAAIEEAAAARILAMEQDLLMAQANGNDALAREIQNRIDKENEALDIMNKFGISIEEARVIAEKLAAINAGPDLNQSGFVTPGEQREFDRRQADKQKAQDKINNQEKRDERERGTGLRNVSQDKRRTGTIGERMADAKEQRTRTQENKDIGALQRDQKLPEAEKNAAINKILEGRNQRGNEADIKKAGKQALEDWKKQGADAPQMFDLDGNPIPNAGPNAPGGGGGGGGAADPNAPGKGGGGNNPQDPKKPEPPADPSLAKLDKIITELGAINKSLQC